jgi:hypothetical protein
LVQHATGDRGDACPCREDLVGDADDAELLRETDGAETADRTADDRHHETAAPSPRPYEREDQQRDAAEQHRRRYETGGRQQGRLAGDAHPHCLRAALCRNLELVETDPVVGDVADVHQRRRRRGHCRIELVLDQWDVAEREHDLDVEDVGRHVGVGRDLDGLVRIELERVARCVVVADALAVDEGLARCALLDAGWARAGMARRPHHNDNREQRGQPRQAGLTCHATSFAQYASRRRRDAAVTPATHAHLTHLRRGVPMAELKISAAVGTGAPNRPIDVRIVQYLLNKVRPTEGGPEVRLEMRSGICGPKTIAAIRRFQQQQFGSADGRVDPGKRTLKKLNEIDNRSTDKVIVTNNSVLVAKYGDGAADIELALGELVDADKTRGVVTRVVSLDDPIAMGSLGAPVVTDPTDQQANKAAIDAVYVATLPDYLMIVGAPDVVPHQDLVNPVYQAGADDDVTVPSDLPYACEARYSTDIKTFLAPTRVVGRLPDLMANTHDGSAEPSVLVDLLDRASTWRSQRRGAYQDPLAMSAAVWTGSSQLSVAHTFGSTAELHLVPPDGPEWEDEQIAFRSHFINCHGSPIDPTFYGQPADGESKFPEAHLASRLAGRVSRGTVVAAECCYGAELYDPADQVDGQAGFANTYLNEGAHGFCGSSNIAYGPSDTNDLADLICQWFLDGMLDGASLGRALLDTRQRYVLDGHTGPTDLKTLAQFHLIGDPSIHPVRSAQQRHRALGAAEDDEMPIDPTASRQERRARSRAMAAVLESMPVARAAPDRGRPPEVDEALRTLTERTGRSYGEPLTFVVEGGAAARDRGLTDEVTPDVAIHVLLSGDTDASIPGRVVHVIEAREEHGTIVGYREYSSR